MSNILNMVMGIILIVASLLLPIFLILVNKEILLDYSFGFTMGAMMVAGIMMFNA